MTAIIKDQEDKGKITTSNVLDLEIKKLLQESELGSGIEWLLEFDTKVGKGVKKLTEKEQQSALDEIKQDIQNPEFLSFESWEKLGNDFGFEGLGDDVIPTLSPYGDCIVPVNFRYNNQRRTILLVFKITYKGKNHYDLPEGDNIYLLDYGKEQFSYQLIEKKSGFRMAIVE